MSGFYKGVAAEQETLFTTADKKLMRSTKFPASYDTKVDMKKVNIEVLKPWIATRLNELIGFEDEVVINFVYGMLEEAVEASKTSDSQNESTLDPRKVQLNLTGFLESNATAFTEELWSLIISASQNQYGIPEKFILEKKEEISKLKDRTEASKEESKTVTDHSNRRESRRESTYYDSRERNGKRTSRSTLDRKRFHDASDTERNRYGRSPSPHSRFSEKPRGERYDIRSYSRSHKERYEDRYRPTRRRERHYRTRDDEGFDEFGRSRDGRWRESRTSYREKHRYDRDALSSESDSGTQKHD
ncbi:splicing coactivator Pwi1 [Schizosaccharomyces pombe]|uniref:PWI domain-containing protein C825.05c n=1 Tax=Schizosaccharomyces pombe (strain 972 / ATCC 24843) TaxID=284812 RepID=YJQ5_SCHPO|nr:putative splicing coactivator SRRM1 [Schizosaccharomyces pombe]Q9USH5.1 RecName: Full=PWI domain-containing protein C825.05c [Schizosaccharomyces pombe 972h-]CAB58413.1 splicing coactivator SRRM1 (predicted) [Schizosaccharomyces pombe]|eukprot:NP_588055.1 putative splicing coactivator SRRM1 [Schizosaccharomyces pombe]